MMPETTPLLSMKMASTLFPTFTGAIRTEKGRLPQAIAHRGYKTEFPENTMSAFQGAIAIGADALETDIHITRDNVAVLSHDPTLKRCFGVDKKIIDCDWEYINTLRTLREPVQPMPRLQDLLEYLASPGLEEIWVLLDIKLDNDLEDVFRLIAETLNKVPPSSKRVWRERILMGCWAAKQLKPCIRYLPGYPISHIGFSTLYARQFLKVPGISFNMLQKTMTGPVGRRFLRDVKEAGRPIFLWTVNDEEAMKWSIRKEVDGVITDDPKRYLEVRKRYQGEKPRLKWKELGLLLFYHTLAMSFGLILRLKFGFRVNEKEIRGLLEEASKRLPEGTSDAPGTRRFGKGSATT